MVPDRAVADEILREAGVPDHALNRWDGEFIGIHRPYSVGASAEMVLRRAQETSESGDYVLDLGSYVMGLARAKGEILMVALTETKIPFERRSVKAEWQRKKWSRESAPRDP